MLLVVTLQNNLVELEKNSSKKNGIMTMLPNRGNFKIHGIHLPEFLNKFPAEKFWELEVHTC